MFLSWRSLGKSNLRDICISACSGEIRCFHRDCPSSKEKSKFQIMRIKITYTRINALAVVVDLRMAAQVWWEPARLCLFVEYSALSLSTYISIVGSLNQMKKRERKISIVMFSMSSINVSKECGKAHEQNVLCWVYLILYKQKMWSIKTRNIRKWSNQCGYLVYHNIFTARTKIWLLDNYIPKYLPFSSVFIDQIACKSLSSHVRIIRQ